MDTNEIIKGLIDRIGKLEKDVLSRTQNQIKVPFDEMSKVNLSKSGFPVKIGTGTFGTQVAVVVGSSVTVPAQPSGTVKVRINGVIVELLVK